MTTKFKKTAISVLFALFIAFAALFIVSLNGARVNGASATLESEYMVGDTVEIPEKTIGGVKADAIVHFPSGTALKTDTVTLSEAGVYTVEYRVNANGGFSTLEETFLAVRKLYSFSGTVSSGEYGVDKSSYDTGRTGLNLKIAQGETLTFEQTFNIHELSGEFLKFYVTPQTRGTTDAQGLMIYVTDVNDPDNYIKIKFQSVTFAGNTYVYFASYVQAAHNEETLSYINGNTGAVMRGGRFGTGCYLSLYGNAEDYADLDSNVKSPREAYASFVYDPATKQLLVGDATHKPHVCIDFDDVACFSNVWEGFSTGEVRVSVAPYAYTGQFFNLNLLSLGGVDLSKTEARDTEAPEITVYYGEYSEDALPACVAGKSYRVFDAVALDKFDGIIEPSVKVYYAKDSESELNIPVTDGEFDTEFAGKYTIIYTATDISGNESRKEMLLIAEEGENTLEISLSSGAPTACKEGEMISIAVPSVSGGIGYADLSIETDKNSYLNGAEYTMRPLESGVITVTYTAEDFVGNKATVSYTVTVSKNDVPVVIDAVNLPKYVFARLATVFPTVSAFDFNQDEYVDTALYVNGELCENNSYTAEESLIGSYAEVEYRVGDIAVYESSVKVLNVRNADSTVNFVNYFVSDDIATSIDADSVKFTASADGTVEYAKALLFDDGFSTTVNFFDGKAAFGKLEITVTDAADPSNFTVFGLVNNVSAGKTDLYVDGVKTDYAISTGGFYEYSAFRLSFVGGYFVNNMNSVRVRVPGFEPETVYLSYTFFGVTAESVIGVSEVSGQRFCLNENMTTDNGAPQYKIFGDYPSNTGINTVITVARAVSCDVLDSYSKMTVKVIAPNGDVIVAERNSDEEFDITLTQYGKYEIQYFTCDSAYGTPWTRNNGKSIVYSINCINSVKPVITVNGDISATLHVGDTVVIPGALSGNGLNGKVELPSATATDDIDGTVSVSYYILDPSNKITWLTTEKSDVIKATYEYTFKKTGNYTLRFTATDNSGNITVKDVMFTVVK